MTRMKVWWLKGEHERKIMVKEVDLDQSLGETTNLSNTRKNGTSLSYCY